MLGDTTLQLLRYLALYALPVGAGLAVLSTPIVDLLFSDTWHDAAPLLVPIAAAAALYTVVFPLGDLLKAVGRQSAIVKINVVLIPLMITACVVSAPAGILAISWALVGTSATFALLMCIAVMRELHVGPRAFARPFAPGLTCAVGVLASAGAVRHTWPAVSWPAVVTAAVAGAGGAVLALGLTAPRTLADLRRQLRDLVPRGRPAATTR
jgi:O-antigen/teichoic acid export membrane protein